MCIQEEKPEFFQFCKMKHVQQISVQHPKSEKTILYYQYL